MIRLQLIKLLFFCHSFLLLSCQITNVKVSSGDTISYCSPNQTYKNKQTEIPKEVILTDSILLIKFSEKDLMLANAAGIYDLLRIIDSVEYSTNNRKDTLLSIKQEMIVRLLQFSSQISSVVAELDCEGERTDQIANYLSELESKRVNKLTIASIITGAFTGIGTTVTEGEKINKPIGIGGGVISAGLGLLALFTKNKIHFSHYRNLLSEIWNEEKESSLFPNSVWYILNDKQFSNTPDYSMRQSLKERWIQFGYIKGKDTDLYFGKGGIYDAHQLKTRSNMLNQLQSSVREINQDLEVLITKINNE